MTFAATLPPELGNTGPFLYSDNRLMNALPTADAPWPPIQFNPIIYNQRLWSAWWSGDPDQLMRAYYSLGANSPIGRSYFSSTWEAGLPAPRPGQFRGGLLGSIRRWFWGQPTPPGEKRTNYHVPLAGDIAAASAALLFSQPPAVKRTASSDIQDYLDALITDGIHSTFLEAAETCAALGGVFLRVVWDTSIADRPWIDIVPPDAAIPEFKYGRLVSVTFWREIRREGNTVIRHLEKHIPAQNAIVHGVFVGEDGKLGSRHPLTDFPETSPYAESLTDGDAITFPDLPLDASSVVYVPNMRPNRIWRDLGPQAAPLGRSDYSGLESSLDALDEAMSSWMRDIRLGKARLLVPDSFLDNIGRGKGAVFEPDREVYSPVAMMVSGEATAAQQIMPQQFNIRYQAHAETVNAIIEQIITLAGYSGQTLGIQGDIATTATEVVARERKSLTTRGKKITYWRPAIADILYGLMAISKSVFGDDIDPVRPDIDFPDVVQPDALEAAQTIAALRGAEVMSMETGVAQAHSDWPPEKVALEVGRIYDEISADMLAKASVRLSGPMDESLGQQLAEIPAAIGETDVAAQVEQVAEEQQSSDSD